MGAGSELRTKRRAEKLRPRGGDDKRRRGEENGDGVKENRGQSRWAQEI